MSREHLDPSDDAKYLAAHIEALTEVAERLVEIMERLAPLLDPRFVRYEARPQLPPADPDLIGTP